MAIITARLEHVKSGSTQIVDQDVVEQACARVGYRWRDRVLDPCTTLRAFVAQVANGNTAIADLVRIMQEAFCEAAYCKARQRLPCSVVRAVLTEFTQRVRSVCDAAAGRDGLWHGHRTALMDGSGVALPDTAELRTSFGTPSQYAPGCGLPQAKLLMLFDARHGLLLDVAAACASTPDLRHAHQLHPVLREGDILVGDRGLCSFAHLALLGQKNLHGVFRVSRSWRIDFPASPGPRRRHKYNRHRSREAIQIGSSGPDDQLIEIVKPHNRPEQFSPEEFAKLPSKMLVRAVRYRVEQPGFRPREIRLLTTLLDSSKYPAADLAELYLSRWRIEQNIRHLKRTLGMERLKCQSPAGVERELMVFALVYNAVCVTRALAANAQEVEPPRIRFVDTLRWMRHEAGQAPETIIAPSLLQVLPRRPPRIHPRLKKRSDDRYGVLRRPRQQMIDWIIRKIARDK